MTARKPASAKAPAKAPGKPPAKARAKAAAKAAAHAPVKIRTRGAVFIIPRNQYHNWLATAGAPELPIIRRGQYYPALDYLRISIARELVRRRIGADLSQSALAERAGVSRATIARTELGQMIPTERVLKRIERVLPPEISPASQH